MLLALTLSLLPRAAAQTNDVAVPGGLTLSTDLRDDYLAQNKLLVRFTVRNDTSAALTFPDLAARPWLVHFWVTDTRGDKTELFNTPPATDPGTTWTISPRGRRSVLLEVPTSAAFKAGDYTFDVQLTSPALDLGARTIHVDTPNPIAGTPVYDSAIAASSGPAFPWVQSTPRGNQLYLMQYTAAGKAVEGQYFLTSLTAGVDPVISRSRAQDASARWVYWIEGGRTVVMARLDGTTLRDEPARVTAGWPTMVPLGRGVTNAKGGLDLPVWVPAPTGTSGSVKVLCISDRGGIVARNVADFTTRPTVVTTTADAGGNFAMLLGHDRGLDLYRVDAAADPILPAKGQRLYKLTSGEAVLGAAFTNLPANGTSPGGLSVFGLVRGADGKTASRKLFDLNAKVLDAAAPVAWTATGSVLDVWSSGYGAWGAVGNDPSGWWSASSDGTLRKFTPAGKTPAALWTTTPPQLRQLGGASVVLSTSVPAVP